MRPTRVRRPSPALVVAVLALLVALAGTGYAAIALPANSVGSRQLKRSAVTRTKLAADSVSGSKVKDRSLLAADFAAGQLPVGPRGATGPQGGTGHAGRDGAAIAVRARSSVGVNTPADHSTVTVPLAASAWTQAPDELDLGPYGRVTYTAPDASSCGASGLADLMIQIDVDGKAFSVTNISTIRDGGTRSATLDPSRYLFEPGQSRPHVATATALSVCESGPAAAPFTVSDVRFDLIRAM